MGDAELLRDGGAMNTNVVLHIGMPKTGTTSLQRGYLPIVDNKTDSIVVTNEKLGLSGAGIPEGIVGRVDVVVQRWRRHFGDVRTVHAQSDAVRRFWECVGRERGWPEPLDEPALSSEADAHEPLAELPLLTSVAKRLDAWRDEEFAA